MGVYGRGMSLVVVVQNMSKRKPVKGLSDNYGRLPNDSVYNYEVRINERVIASGQGLKHKRSDGWPTLLRRLLKHNLKRAT